MTMDEIAAQLLEAYNKVEAAIKKFDKEHGRLRSLAAKNGPFKIDDIVDCNGRSYEGKSMMVSEIRLYVENTQQGCQQVLLAAHGFVLEKDGTPGKNIGKRTVVIVERELTNDPDL